ncbi:MAG: glycoside hydrolase family 13 protein [Eubacterium sp.]
MGELRRDAIFSSGTETFVTPLEPEKNGLVTLRCRTAKGNADEVYLVHEDSLLEMHIEYSTELFDFYAIDVRLGEVPFSYYFKIQKENTVIYFNKRGDVDTPNPQFSYCLFPGFHTPDWAKGAVMYQIYTDRFYNGDITNDVVDDEYCYIGAHVQHVKEWEKNPALMDVREFYGGDLQGVLDKLDYLQELGVEVIYLNPIFVSPSNHKYDTQDYDYVDPHFTVIAEDGGETLADGDNDNSHATKYRKRVADKKNLEASNQFFAKFMEEVHARGMRVIMDGVFNHCGSFNKWLDREQLYEKDSSYDKGAFVSEESPYHDFFQFYPDGSWPYNTHYDGWWGHDTLPKLNYEGSRKLFDYIMRIAKKWVSAPYNVDGWRLDVAADLGHSGEYNHSFWKAFRKAVKEANPEAIILAEHYGDPSSWLSGDQWDTVMNYDAFMEPVSWFLTGVDKHSDVSKPERKGDSGFFFALMTEYGARFGMQSYMVAMNELSNHDHSRFLTRTNGMVGRVASAGSEAAAFGVKKSVMMAGVMIQMTWPGAPTVYYGDEVGVCGWTDPDNRRTFPWGKEDKQLLGFHKEMIRIHKDYEVLRTGALIYLICEAGMIGYGRFDAGEWVCVLIQTTGEKKTVSVPVWRLGATDGSYMASMMSCGKEGYTIAAKLYEVKDGCIEVDVMPEGGIVLKSVERAY